EASGPLEPQLAKLKEKIHPLNGILRVDNPTQTLTLDGSIQGKLVIVTGQGGVKLTNFNKNERASDLITVISLGGTMTIEDEVHAALISTDRGISVKPGAVVHGLLVMDRLPSAPDRQLT